MKTFKKDVTNKPLKNMSFLKTEFGQMGLAELDGLICDVFLTRRTILSNVVERETAVLREAKNQIKEYLGGRRRAFDLPLSLSGSEFQRAVLEEVLRIPYGETRSYRQIAQDVGRPRAARAVGTANRHCRISIIVPCHRVIRSDGSLAGFGEENHLRDYLLKLEYENSR